MRRTASASRHHSARASGVLAVLLLSAVPFAAPPGARAADRVELPVLRSELGPGVPCTDASVRTAKARPWTVGALGLTRAWSLSRGAGVKVAVVDTGVGRGVPALEGRVSGAGDATTDCVGHGSFAAALIAGAPLDGVGPVGVAPGAEILAVRGTQERGATTPERLADAVREAADAGAGVIYVGIALESGRTELSRAVAYAARKDALVVAPAAPDVLPEDGSGDPVPAAPWYWPAAAPGALAVQDYGPGGSRPEGAPVATGVDLAAPGDAVAGAGPDGSGHFIGSGSSLAAAHVAGAAALVRARHPGLTARQVARQLTSSAYPADVPRLDPYAALTTLPQSRRGSAPAQQAARRAEPPSTAARDRALLVAGAGAGVVLLTAAAAAAVPRGRARRWRPAGGE
ncbi:S8 family serine peptidase [Streptomyces sp. GC420]|uniref:S8 family serine peptidase n=1 Tax=Streptomyces sp. GC420 TaxID=2697568 RepID=UPI001414D50D|nr:S8 family serine peptidase [Streptomyces sp. GC420]NBM15792.1 S8 family serine peptidase [Streptomyces sp. GC420]